MSHVAKTITAIMLLWARERFNLTKTYYEKATTEEEPTVAKVAIAEEPKVAKVAKVEETVDRYGFRSIRPYGIYWGNRLITALDTGHLCSLVEAYQRGYFKGAKCNLPTPYQASAVMAELYTRTTLCYRVRVQALFS